MSIAHAQQDQEPGVDTEVIEEIIVTGSRIPVSEFTSPSPIQVLDVQESRQIGISSIAEMLQRAPVTNGTQIDATLNSGAANSNATEEPPIGGVGSTNVSLRGLGPERTLILVNGRRLGSAGVRGAPAQPNMAMIPLSLVDRVEVLTEGVSAVYGADAVAGVVNVILRDEFEGLELTLAAEQPQDPGGEIRQLSMTAGMSNDRGNMTFSAEYFDRERVLTGDRDFSRCLQEILITPDNEVLQYCFSPFPDNVVFVPELGPPLHYIPDGSTDIEVPGFGTWFAADPGPRPNNVGLADNPINNTVGSRFYSDQDERRAADIVGELERFSAVMTGRMNFDWWSNEEIYFEGYYLNSQVFSIANAEQVFPGIPGQIPQEDANGNIIVDAAGEPILVSNPLNPFGLDALPIVTLDSLPQTRDVETQQFRIVSGLRGDFGDTSWSYDGFLSYDRGTGFQAQPILFEPNLILGTQTVRLNADGEPVCGLIDPTGGLGIATPDACVPIDFFADNIFVGGPTGEGAFTPEEEAFLIGNRTNRTVVEQTMLSIYAIGDLFQIGDYSATAAIGAEYRKDAIDSQNDIVGVQGLNAAENPLQEGETIGERDIFEAFAELRVPVLDTLQIDGALRFTDEENFGSETTWRTRVIWQPLDYLSLSASAGTSFRPPNLREQFLAGQGGGLPGSIDPCNANDITQLISDPQRGQTDPQVQLLIGNCVADDLMFTDSDGDGNLDTGGVTSSATILSSAGGNPGLRPETSESKTATLQFNAPWSGRFDIEFALSWWSIDIHNTIDELDAGAILSRCYRDPDFPNGTSPFCERTRRYESEISGVGQLSFIDISFVNIGLQTAEGVDLNTRLGFPIDRWDLEVSWLTAATHQLEQVTRIDRPEDRDDNVGEIGTPRIRLTSTLLVQRGDLELMMQNRFIDGGSVDEPADFRPALPFVFEDMREIRPVDFVNSTWYTDLSLTYRADNWMITLGANNVFDEDPPLIAFFAGPNRNNAVTSSGYDLIGRTFFLTASIAL